MSSVRGMRFACLPQEGLFERRSEDNWIRQGTDDFLWECQTEARRLGDVRIPSYGIDPRDDDTPSDDEVDYWIVTTTEQVASSPDLLFHGKPRFVAVILRGADPDSTWFGVAATPEQLGNPAVYLTIKEAVGAFVAWRGQLVG